MKKTSLPLCLMLALISGCSQKSSETEFCSLAHPIYLNKVDNITEDTKREILGYFEMGRELCGWPPTH